MIVDRLLCCAIPISASPAGSDVLVLRRNSSTEFPDCPNQHFNRIARRRRKIGYVSRVGRCRIQEIFYVLKRCFKSVHWVSSSKLPQDSLRPALGYSAVRAIRQGEKSARPFRWPRHTQRQSHRRRELLQSSPSSSPSFEALTSSSFVCCGWARESLSHPASHAPALWLLRRCPIGTLADYCLVWCWADGKAPHLRGFPQTVFAVTFLKCNNYRSTSQEILFDRKHSTRRDK